MCECKFQDGGKGVLGGGTISCSSCGLGSMYHNCIVHSNLFNIFIALKRRNTQLSVDCKFLLYCIYFYFFKLILSNSIFYF